MVYPVVRDGVALALKRYSRPLADESLPLRESVALRHWAGHGAPRLVAADPSAGALLVERLGTDARDAWIDQVGEQIGDLLVQLRQSAPANVPWAVDFLAAALNSDAAQGLPRRLAERALRLLGELPDPGVLLHGSLRSDHLLLDLDGDGLAVKGISPRPVSGHQGLELVAHLLERPEEYPDGSGLRWGTRHRIELACESAGLPEEECRLWAYLGVAAEAAVCSDRERRSFLLAILKTLDG